MKRQSGVLLHISSLPGPFGIGDSGPSAERFADFISAAGFSLWQILPVSPISSAFGNSPYSSSSVFAASDCFISPEKLVRDGLLCEEDIFRYRGESGLRADYSAARKIRRELLLTARRNYLSEPGRFKEISDGFADFCMEESYWLDDYAVFNALKDELGDVCWNEWPAKYCFRDNGAIASFVGDPSNNDRISFTKFSQYIFMRHWDSLCAYCRDRNISIIGDMPMFAALDSSDVWAHQNMFDLDANGRPNCVAGVPPDYFSATGQRWGNPLYRWDKMEADGFDWWNRRMERSLRCFDIVRVDHFRGFCGYWAIPASDETAVNGEWRAAPGGKFFEMLSKKMSAERLGNSVIAEDLGIITDDVTNLKNAMGFPGMDVLLFAFGSGIADNPYIPHNIPRNSVMYTGTHDNNTAAGWWSDEASEEERRNFCAYLGRTPGDCGEAASLMVTAAMTSQADMTVIPMQDLLGLGSSCRMNTPGRTANNWQWRLTEQQFASVSSADSDIIRKLALLNSISGRAPK